MSSSTPRVRSGSPAAAPPAGSARGMVSDEDVWRRLKEAGFDEEVVRRRDKAALVAYIARLETELFDYQHNMGLLIMEKKDWMSKYEKIRVALELAEFSYKHDQASNLSTIAEAKKREENLQRALDVEKECIANLEKALHELRAECAETKVASEFKLTEARKLVEDAQKMFDEAAEKIHASESLNAEASRSERSASRKLLEVEAREDELRRRQILSVSELDAKEKDLSLERQSIVETQKILKQEHEHILEQQTFFNQREESIFGKSLELDRLEKELEAAKASIEEELMDIKLEKSNLDSALSSLAVRQEAITERESQLTRREKDLIAMQENLAVKERDEIQRLKAEYEVALVKRKSEFEDNLARQRKLVEDELDTNKQKLELRMAEIDEKEKVIYEKENILQLQLNALLNREADVTEKLKVLSEKEKSLSVAKVTAEKEMLELQKEREEIKKMRLDLEKTKKSFEDEKIQFTLAREKLVVTVAERNELLVLEMKLKEEIDSFRAQKMELSTKVDTLRAEKEKFEHEWELIDEKKNKLQKEVELFAEERNAAWQYLKNERASLKLEKEALQNQFKNDFESLSREREETIGKLEREHLEWFSKIQHERDALLEEIKLQKKELETCIEKRREELEAYLREKEESFEKGKAIELQNICSQNKMLEKELEHVQLERKRLDQERMEITEDRAVRDKEWSEIKRSLHELNIQREKLQAQREMLITEKEEINAKIKHLKELQYLQIAAENRALSESPVCATKPVQTESGRRSSSHIRLKNTVNVPNSTNKVQECSLKNVTPRKPVDVSPPTPVTLSWIKRCTDMIFRHPSENGADIPSVNETCHDVEPNSSQSEGLEGQHLGHSNGGLVVRRKRLKDSSLHVDTINDLGTAQNHPKRRRQEEITEAAFQGETVPANVTPTTTLHPEGPEHTDGVILSTENSEDHARKAYKEFAQEKMVDLAEVALPMRDASSSNSEEKTIEEHDIERLCPMPC